MLEHVDGYNGVEGVTQRDFVHRRVDGFDAPHVPDVVPVDLARLDCLHGAAGLLGRREQMARARPDFKHRAAGERQRVPSRPSGLLAGEREE
jgi:hypothetical protein